VSAVLLPLSFAVILAGALLFTNAVEWLGRRLALGEGAVGSLLAAVGTAMPETLIPIVAIIGGKEGSEDVAVGAIVGAPFLLATIAMMIVGLAALGYQRRRSQGRALRAHAPTLDRDLGFFLVFFGAALAFGIGAPEAVRIPAAFGFAAAYVVYVWRTLARGGELQAEETFNPLYVSRPLNRGPALGPGAVPQPALAAVVFQLIVGLGAMVGGAHLFVEELLHVAEDIGVEPIVLSLVLAPLATELPEKANSFFWVREGKDALALGNITGAMAFQSTVPVAFGLAFTDWNLDRYAALSISLGLAGGIVAYWALRLRGRYNAPAIVAWGGLYAIFLAYVIVS
jgi:cation:H+ antiporter